ncbi:MAG: hypothetical protein M1608_02350 [Candidatus Omnitrophica bacterium]|nr:hypothetical protein [Candidatus Omnitrophota bacterium]
MKRIATAIVLLAALLLAYGLWQKWFSSDESIIRRQLRQLAADASFPPDEGLLARLGRANRLIGFFSHDVTLHLTGVPMEIAEINGRAQLRQAILSAQAGLHQTRVRFPDIQIDLNQNHESALVDLTVLADVDAEKDAVVQELNFVLRKVDGKWLIKDVESIETLRK